MSAIVLIPARFASTRFPGKPLALLRGRPMIEHVYRNSLGSGRAGAVVVATDHPAIFDAVTGFGGKAVMTSGTHESGTDRIAEALRVLGSGYDIIVNVQGDEPLINPGMIDAVIDLLDDPDAAMGTLIRRIEKPEELVNPNIVKAVFDDRYFALYFSRAPIPFPRNGRTPDTGAYRHIGIYSYRRSALERLTSLPPSRLERIEMLEQLRALEHGLRIKLAETPFDTCGVDTPEDLERIEQCQSSSS